jgi:SAM-dependent methyltransferase
MAHAPWMVDGVDDQTPNPARMYDYFLGGFHNFAADRELAERTIAAWPQVPAIARANRTFLGRAVRHLVESGVRQFLDLGSGVPTVGNVHDIAQGLAPDARVVYVDVEPVAVAHSRQILRGNPNAAVVLADLRRPDLVLADSAVRNLLDLTRPVALLMVAVLHFVPDSDEAAAAIRAYREALGPGSWVVVSHGTEGALPEELKEQVGALYRQTSSRAVSRTRAELTALLDGYDLMDPGLVQVNRWRPDSVAPGGDPQHCPVWAGIGRAR